MNRKRMLRHCLLVPALFAAALLTGCTLTPGVSLGLDVDYYGGKFHVNPAAHVGITGRP